MSRHPKCLQNVYPLAMLWNVESGWDGVRWPLAVGLTYATCDHSHLYGLKVLISMPLQVLVVLSIKMLNPKPNLLVRRNARCLGDR
jgi:hypothetical protein